MKKRINNDGLRSRFRHPNVERVAKTTNDLAEDMFDSVTRERAIEAVGFWRDECERIQQSLTLLRSTVVLKATELVHDVCKTYQPPPAAGRRRRNEPDEVV